MLSQPAMLFPGRTLSIGTDWVGETEKASCYRPAGDTLSHCVNLSLSVGPCLRPNSHEGQIFVTVMNTCSGPPCDRHRGRMVDTVRWWETQAGTWRQGHARLYSPFLLTQRWAACPGAHASRAGEQVPAHCKHGLNITPVAAASSSSLFLFWGFCLFVCLFVLSF